MRFVDLILAIVVLLLLVAVARREFPGYESRTMPRLVVEASPVPSPAPE